jgi:hypothetical protein
VPRHKPKRIPLPTLQYGIIENTKRIDEEAVSFSIRFSTGITHFILTDYGTPTGQEFIESLGYSEPEMLEGRLCTVTVDDNEVIMVVEILDYLVIEAPLTEYSFTQEKSP